MKRNFKSLMLLFSIVLLVGTIVIGACSAQSSQDYLKIKGIVSNDYNAAITVYSQNVESDEWTKVATKHISTKYRLRLATDKNYQISFISDEGFTKIVHIKAGEPGMYLEYVDIDFKGSSERHACMYQNDDGYYTFQTKIAYASLE